MNYIDPWGLAKITVYVKRAGPWGNRNSKTGWGHAWAEIEDDFGNKTNRGSYPGGLRDDSNANKRVDISHSIDISQEQFSVVKQHFENYGNDNWTKTSENCVDFVYHAVEDWAGQNLPGSDWGIDHPNKLSEDLKKINGGKKK